MNGTHWVVLAIIVILVFFACVYYYHKHKCKVDNAVEVDKAQLETLANYVAQRKQEEERVAVAKQERKDLMKVQLETFKQTKEELKESLRTQIDQKQWKNLGDVMNLADKGGVGIYILYNASKDKYYVGQAKQIFKRIREHFKVEDIARDYMAGDDIQVKFLTANEIGGDYRLDHIEKTGIEIFNAGKTGYNRTEGNV